jgi:AAA family ATP:ADP antiporter
MARAAGGEEIAETRARGRLVAIQSGEAAAVGWAGALFFLVLASYFVLRPLRDAMGVPSGERVWTGLYLGTLLLALAANPVFGALVARFPRRVFLPVVYHALAALVVVFWLLLWRLEGEPRQLAARLFFNWVSVFNLFAVSTFWGFLADLFRSDQGRRLFGFIAGGGTLGALAGSARTATFAERIPPVHLMLAAAALLEGAVFALRRLGRVCGVDRGEGTPVAGGWLAGARLVAGSRYLQWICVYLLIFTIGSTFLYAQQQQVVRAAFTDPGRRAAWFARVDLTVNAITAAVEFLLTARIVALLGVGGALAVLPLVTLAGFLAVGAAPVLPLFAAFQVLRRTSEFSVSKPAREMLFTVIPRAEKYTAKNLIDVFVYRGGDLVAAAVFDVLQGFGLGTAALSLTMVPLAAGWIGVALLLGRRMREREVTAGCAPGPVPATAPGTAAPSSRGDPR